MRRIGGLRDSNPNSLCDICPTSAAQDVAMQSKGPDARSTVQDGEYEQWPFRPKHGCKAHVKDIVVWPCRVLVWLQQQACLSTRDCPWQYSILASKTQIGSASVPM